MEPLRVRRWLPGPTRRDRCSHTGGSPARRRESGSRSPSNSTPRSGSAVEAILCERSGDGCRECPLEPRRIRHRRDRGEARGIGRRPHRTRPPRSGRRHPRGGPRPVTLLYLVSVRARREVTTVNDRVSRSSRAVAPLPVRAVMVTLWVPRLSFGRGTRMVSYASARRPSTWRPRLSESTEKVTRASAGSAVPNARSPISGRSETRYSGAIVASAKNGRPTGIRTDPSPAVRPAPIAEALTCHEVRSSERGKVTVARPSRPVSMLLKRTVSRKSSRPPPVVSPPPSLLPRGARWDRYLARMPKGTPAYSSPSGSADSAPPSANSFSSTARRTTVAATGSPDRSRVVTVIVTSSPGA